MADSSAKAETVAIMQPYFVPYAGYFRLMAAADLFVLYDCVQFPRRGWVHRNRLPDSSGAPQWLTLPLAHAPRDVTIQELAFRPDAAETMDAACRRFPLLAGRREDTHGLIDALRDVNLTPLDYIERLLARAAAALDLPWRVLRSSSLKIPAEVAGQERIVAIVRALAARRYVNSPGGRALYEPARFAQAGLELRFLPEHEGSFASILARLLQEPAEEIAREIRDNTRLVP